MFLQCLRVIISNNYTNLKKFLKIDLRGVVGVAGDCVEGPGTIGILVVGICLSTNNNFGGLGFLRFLFRFAL